jgi:imidazolonepropionase-like amidohydrolase
MKTVAMTILLLGLSACHHTHSDQGKKTTADSKPGAGKWTDNASFLPVPRHQDRGVQSLEDALKNPKAPSIAITNVTIMTAAGDTIEGGSIVLKGGSIVDLGKSPSIPKDAKRIDGSGRFITPGIIDTHSHIGVYSSPGTDANSDGNEAVAPTTPHARARYGYWAQDPQITRARAGGVTTALILPGSANLIGGRGYTTIMRPGGVASDHSFPGAPTTLKMACGENPKRVYGQKGGPQTRMGLYAAFRAAFQKAAEYNVALLKYERDYQDWTEKKSRGEAGEKLEASAAPDKPARDLGLETLAAVLRGEVLVQVHCYRADDIKQLVEVSDEYGFDIRSFHHAIEAYKVRDLLVEHDISISTWTEWWGFKMEAMDGIQENAALMTDAGGRAIIHSDSALDIQHLNQEAAKGMYMGRAAGIPITEDQALAWITANPAWALGIDSVTGTLEKGKRADVVLWSGHPFSVYSLPDTVIQGGEIAYERSVGRMPTDFELGNSTSDAPEKATAQGATR